VLAAELLRADPRISEVYMLGWSLGGSLAPRIHASGGNFDGLILFAGSPRSLADIAYDQFIADITRTIDVFGELPELVTMLADVAAFVEIIESIPNMTDDEAKELWIPMLNTHAYYYKEMTANSFEYFVERITVPMLIMQGRNDFQVLADTDFVLLQELLDGRGNVTFNLYDDLDHFFMPTIAQNFSEHRDVAIMRLQDSRVDQQALRDVVDWVMTQ
jgi:pimeloyl-ACP methyl ester carboxylesterase